MNKIFVVFMILATSSVGAQTVSEVLNQQLVQIQTKMGTGSYEDMALKACANKARPESFAIQAIGRLFDKEKKIFKELKIDFKGLEDHIGHVAKWTDMLKLTDLPVEKQTRYTAKKVEALKNFTDFLVKLSFKDKLARYKLEIEKLQISEAKTKKLVMSGIKEDIQEITSKKYDFVYGETGLHELRRNIRWPVIGLQTFKSLFTTKKKDCRSTRYYAPGIESKYNDIIENPSATLSVDYCAYIEIMGAVEQLGNIKDELESKEVLEDKLPVEHFKMTSDIFSDLVKDILPSLLN
ncbi:MAG TPA: hypothetical protein VNJ08_00615 [Bacteriovoracaceae bacterium]|nr:hypothetical protein [Bacteriovoracaceae bacterium]